MEIKDLEPTINELVVHVGLLKNELEELRQEVKTLKSFHLENVRFGRDTVENELEL